jgi:tetratricopeptide (TPR) repeat protein
MVAGLSYMMFPRPHAFGFIFLALLAFFLFKSPSNPKARKLERWLIIPLIFWIWANMHAGFILGLGVYWVVAVREFVLPEINGGNLNSRFKTSIAPAMLATILCLANPNGIAIFLYPFQISGTSTFKSTIAEWVSPIYLGRAEWLAQALFYLAGALGLGVAILHLKKRPDISFIIVVVEILAWFARRNIQNFVIILAFSLLAIPAIPSLKRLQLTRTAQRAIFFAAAVWMLAWFALIRNYQAGHDSLGIGIQKRLAPIGAADFLNKMSYEGNIVNILADGGYLIWAGYPRWKVFIDGRLDVYGEEQIKNYRLVVGGATGALDLLDQINVGAAVLQMPPGMGELRNFLSIDSRWSLVYFDDYYLVYLRRNQVNQNIINQWGYNVINPLIPGYGLNDRLKLEAFDNEAARNMSINAESGLANSICGYASQSKEQYLPAANYYKKALEIKPELIGLYLTIGEMYSMAGVFDSAMTWYDRAQKITPDNPQIFIDIAYLYARRNELVKTEFYLNEALKRDPNCQARELLQRLRASKTGR